MVTCSSQISVYKGNVKMISEYIDIVLLLEFVFLLDAVMGAVK